MIATGPGHPDRAPAARKLIKTGIAIALTLSVALIASVWLFYFVAGERSAPTLAALLSTTLAATLAGLYLRQTILDLAAREQDAARQAGHDLLSGLANRLLFTQWVDYELARHRREATQFALMYLDIDHFKEINDRYGHDAGDRMIVAVARRISETLRPTDRLARFGGDEFAILQTGVHSLRDAEALASRVLAAMQKSFDLGKLEILSSVSIGIALCPDNASERDDLMNLADMALYRAKKEGRNRLAFFDTRMGEALARRHDLETELATAIETGALALDYQPIYTAQEQRLTGVEARLRWPHPVRGFIEAKDFVAIAEERGHSLPLGDWVLRKACTDARAWPGLRVAVNVSSIQFRNQDFAPQVLRLLHETGLDPDRLEIQLTEETVLGKPDVAISTMKALRGEGVRFAIAQYGSGMASVNYLRRFPFGKLKIDRLFLEAALGSTENGVILHAITHLGRALGLMVAADGVETEEQMRFLTALGCTEMQGRLLSRHVSAEDVTRLGALSPQNVV